MRNYTKKQVVIEPQTKHHEALKSSRIILSLFLLFLYLLFSCTSEKIQVDNVEINEIINVSKEIKNAKEYLKSNDAKFCLINSTTKFASMNNLDWGHPVLFYDKAFLNIEIPINQSEWGTASFKKIYNGQEQQEKTLPTSTRLIIQKDTLNNEYNHFIVSKIWTSEREIEVNNSYSDISANSITVFYWSSGEFLFAYETKENKVRPLSLNSNIENQLSLQYVIKLGQNEFSLFRREISKVSTRAINDGKYCDNCSIDPLNSECLGGECIAFYLRGGTRLVLECFETLQQTINSSVTSSCKYSSCYKECEKAITEAIGNAPGEASSAYSAMTRQITGLIYHANLSNMDAMSAYYSMWESTGSEIPGFDGMTAYIDLRTFLRGQLYYYLETADYCSHNKCQHERCGICHQYKSSSDNGKCKHIFYCNCDKGPCWGEKCSSCNRCAQPSCTDKVNCPKCVCTICSHSKCTNCNKCTRPSSSLCTKCDCVKHNKCNLCKKCIHIEGTVSTSIHSNLCSMCSCICKDCNGQIDQNTGIPSCWETIVRTVFTEYHYGYTALWEMTVMNDQGYSGYITQDGYFIFDGEYNGVLIDQQIETIKTCRIKRETLFNYSEWGKKWMELTNLKDQITAHTKMGSISESMIIDEQYIMSSDLELSLEDIGALQNSHTAYGYIICDGYVFKCDLSSLGEDVPCYIVERYNTLLN